MHALVESHIEKLGYMYVYQLCSVVNKIDTHMESYIDNENICICISWNNQTLQTH